MVSRRAASSWARGWTTARKVMPVGEGRQGWLVLDQGLYFVDLDAHPRLAPLPLEARDLALLPTRQPQRAWVLANVFGTSEEHEERMIERVAAGAAA